MPCDVSTSLTGAEIRTPRVSTGHWEGTLKISTITASSSIAALAVMLASPAFAAETAPAPVAGAAQSDGTPTGRQTVAGDPNDIIVTAQRRVGRLQDVPASVSVVSSDAIAQQGINDFFDLGFRIPNVQIFENGNLSGRTGVTIRGVPGRAGIFVDDVFVGDDSGINGLLVDVDRVEVLRGPQGTLYGRNSISGAINTITRRPGDEFFAMGKVRYGSFNSVYAAGAIGVPVTEGIAIKASGAYRSSDGYDTERGGGRVNGERNYAFRGQIRIRPTETLDILLSADYQRDNQRNGYSDVFTDYAINGAPGPIYLVGASDGNPNDRIVPRRNAVNREERTLWGLSGRFDLDLGFATLASITAYRETDFLYNRDGDGSNYDIIRGIQPVTYYQISQEFRLQSSGGGNFDWLIGGYYFQDQRRSMDTNFLGSDYLLAFNPGLAPLAPPLTPGGAAGAVTVGRLFASPALQAIVGIVPPAPVLGVQTTQDSNRIVSYAGFASATWRPIQEIELTAGIRYTRERVRATYSRQTSGLLTAFVPPVATQTLDSGWDDNWSPTFSLAWKPSRQISAYATYSRGYRSGGFNTAPPAVAPPANDAAQRRFLPETVESYEIGVKSSLLDNRLAVNLALFKMNYTDFQRSFYTISPVTGAQIQTFNAQASMQGLELEIVARPSREFTVTASYGLQDSQYDNYPNAPVNSFTQTGAPGNPLRVNLTGQPLPFVPRHSVSVAAEYTQPIGSVQIRAGSDIQLRSDYNLSDGIDQIRVVDAVVQMGVHIGIEDPDGRWSILGRVQNLTNQVYRTGLDYNSFVGAVYQNLSAPRTFLIEASFKY